MNDTEISEQIEYLSLDDITPNPWNRKIGGFDQEKIEQMADTIRTSGVLQPVIVRSNGKAKYQLVAGERRCRAARIAGLKTMPCVIRMLNDIELLKIQMIENIQQEDIHPLDEAEGYQRLIDKAGCDVALLAKEIGKSSSYIYQRLKLRDIIPEVREEIIDKQITAGHAILIARLQPEQQKEAIKYCRKKASVRVLDKCIHKKILNKSEKTLETGSENTFSIMILGNKEFIKVLPTTESQFYHLLALLKKAGGEVI